MLALARAQFHFAGPVPIAANTAQSSGSSTASLPSSTEQAPKQSEAAKKKQEAVNEGVRSSGLLTPELRSFYTFGIPFSFSDERDVSACTQAAAEYLIAPPPADDVVPALINRKQMMNTHLIVISNLIPQSAAAEGQSWSPTQHREWCAIVKTLWSLLANQHGQVHVCGAANLAGQWRQALENDLLDSDFDVKTSAFFNDRHAPDGTDSLTPALDTLIGYAVHVACELFAQQQVGKAIAREQRERAREAREPQRRRARMLASIYPDTPRYRARIAENR